MNFYLDGDIYTIRLKQIQKENRIVLVALHRLKELFRRFSDLILWGQSLLKIHTELLNILSIHFHFALSINYLQVNTKLKLNCFKAANMNFTIL